MLVKEYRICMPMTVEDYRIAQLYMIQKKSREESTGSGSGVEILTNEPYDDGPGGKGQYTFKIYHIGSHLPAWFRNILPKSALRVEEEAWNAYPYTKTRYRVPFVEKFTLEVETHYFDDGGEQENIFKLSESERRNLQVDFMDIVADPVSSGDYKAEEDPRIFVSKRTGRGPLEESWRAEFVEAQTNGVNYPAYTPPEGGSPLVLPKKIMCAYKVCRVEFRYWGMQSKIERFIHDVALRKTMVRAHRQAWCWQDEWYGLNIEDIRALEAETARQLANKMAAALGDEATVRGDAIEGAGVEEGDNKGKRGSPIEEASGPGTSQSSTQREDTLAGEWNAQSLECLQTQSSDDEDDEFFDAPGPRVQFLMDYNGDDVDAETASFMTCRSSTTLATREFDSATGDSEVPPDAQYSFSSKSKKSVLFLVVHGGSLLDTHHEYHNKNVDISNFRTTMESVIQSHYPSLKGRIAVRLVACPSVVTETLQTIASLSPCAFNMEGHLENVLAHDFVPLGTIPLFFTSSPHYSQVLSTVATRLNDRYAEFIRSEEGHGFTGPVCIVGDSTGSVLAYDLLCALKKKPNTDASSLQDLSEEDSLSGDDRTSLGEMEHRSLSKSNPDVCSPTSEGQDNIGGLTSTLNLDFEVDDFFMLGSPIALVLAFRQVRVSKKKQNSQPRCHQVYNLFHLTDPCSFRVEPLLDTAFRHIAPVRVPRHSHYPMGDGQPLSLLESVVANAALFAGASSGQSSDSAPPTIRVDTSSSSSSDNMDIALACVPGLRRRWYGSKRVDYGLNCPDGLQAFPIKALPHLLHASYWESNDASAFMIRQLIDVSQMDTMESSITEESGDSVPTQQRVKWKNRGNSIKLKTASPNHRANDVLVMEDQPRILSARFMYGPLDMLSLSGEMVDVYLMTQPSTGQWEYQGTEVTDSGGRIQYRLPESKKLPCGLYPGKMVVRADQSTVDMTLGILPPNTEAVVFSVDGSFAASVSIMGKDPKVRAGGVDVVRHWQDLGYLLIYITARPDMQHRRVVSWLAQHNFPHGMVLFVGGITAEPLRQKTAILNRLVNEVQIKIHCAYGSAKDVSVYRALGLQPNQIFVVGRAAKRCNNTATVLSEGYAAHLGQLISRNTTLSRSAVGAARLFIRRSCFELPQGRKKSARRTGSGPMESTSDQVAPFTALYPPSQSDPEGPQQQKARGVSPRLKLK